MYLIYKLQPQMRNKYEKQYENVKRLDANVCIKTLNSDYNMNLQQKHEEKAGMERKSFSSSLKN